MNRFVAFIVSILVFSIPGVAQSESISCQVQRKQFCGPEDCSEDGGEGEFIQIDLSQNKYKLCTSGTGACDEFELTQVKPSGAFIYFMFGGGGAYLKMAQFHEIEGDWMPKSSSFMEVRDSFLGNFSSWGQCVQVR
jgi:hypothetical protein